MSDAMPGAGSFQELTKELEFFTPAVAYVKAGFDRDIVHEYLLEKSPPDNEAPFSIDCQWPLFQGLGYGKLGREVVNWDKRLYAIPKQRWDEFLRFATSIAFHATKPVTYGRIVCHGLVAVDVVALNTQRPTQVVPAFGMSVFGAAMTTGTWFMAAARDPRRTRPYPMRGAAREDILHDSKPILG